MRIRSWSALTALLLVATVGCSSSDSSSESSTPATDPPSDPPSATATSAPSSTAGTSGSSTTPVGSQTIATGLEVPWGLALLPDGSAFVTLRDRREVLQLRPGSAPRTVATISAVQPDGEAGLLGIALSPSFATDRRVFVYYTAEQDNRIERMRWDGSRLVPDRVILTGIPKAMVHDGGAIAFGPDRQLYVGTGDAGERDRSQDRADLGGKILRVDADGRPAPGNPFPGSPVWSYGHRNVQGLAWDRAGRMYATEFGQNTWDELNLIRRGTNYGWPRVEGKAGAAGLVDPLVVWEPRDSSPSGLAIGADGAAYVAALAGQTLWRVPLQDGRAGTPTKARTPQLGRVRNVVAAPDGRLWLVSSNTFRGETRSGDDRVIAWRPS